MNLSSLVHASGFQQEQSQSPSRHRQIMASSLVANPYTAQATHHAYTYMTTPQAPPSPPVEEAPKCSLPSISSLLDIADGPSTQEQAQQRKHKKSGFPRQYQEINIRTNTDTEATQQHQQQQHQQQQQQFQQQHQHQQHQHQQRQPHAVEYNRQTVQYAAPLAANIRTNLPPTPPMQSESGFDERQSPSATSPPQYPVASAPSYYFGPAVMISATGSAINNVEPHAQRQHQPQSIPRRASIPVSMPYAQTPSPYAPSPYTVSPQQSMNSSMGSYYPSPMQVTPPQQQISGLYYQRPLPTVSFHHSPPSTLAEPYTTILSHLFPDPHQDPS
jgi:hypothetical protein